MLLYDASLGKRVDVIVDEIVDVTEWNDMLVVGRFISCPVVTSHSEQLCTKVVDGRCVDGSMCRWVDGR
jgi:hypothetical protein